MSLCPLRRAPVPVPALAFELNAVFPPRAGSIFSTSLPCVVFHSNSRVSFDSIRLFKGNQTTHGVLQPQALNMEPILPADDIQPQPEVQNLAEDDVNAAVAAVPMKRPTRC